MSPKIDLFNQPVWNDGEYMVIANFTEVWPQYYVYELRTCQMIGTTNATNYMGTCRMIINDYRRQMQNETTKKIKEGLPNVKIQAPHKVAAQRTAAHCKGV